LRSFPVPVQVTLYDSVLVTTRRLKRHDVVTPHDVELQRLPIKSNKDKPLTDISGVIGKRASKALPTGRVLTSGAVEDMPLVRRGDKVTVRYQSNQLLLTTVAEAIEDGWKDRPVRVRSISSRKLITGIVADVGLVDLNSANAGG